MSSVDQKSTSSLKMSDENTEINEKQFKIRPEQQMIAACSGAFVTAITSIFFAFHYSDFLIFVVIRL